MSLYSSWVLLTYAAAEAVVVSQSEACLQVLRVAAPTPYDLPDGILREHRRKTVKTLLGRIEKNEQAAEDELALGAALRAVDNADWAGSSRLMHLGRNVWPEAVRQWLGVIGASAEWMTNAVVGGTETYESRLAALVRERNDIAHGRAPNQVNSSALHLAWIDDTESFFEQVVDSARVALVRQFPNVPLTSVGAVDPAQSLGDYTTAIRALDVDLAVGAKLILQDPSRESVRVTHVKSLYSDDVRHDQLGAGTERVAVSVAAKPDGALLYLAI